ncbi:MAG: NAD+ synthase [Sinobacteraceae bacterium]|nr:NAD+ synthase [Nevskiaceae bacterium]MCP5340083.1 NAD+ synthase [Nevskiaceae bacterium]MCP5359306.1 NAD+ synthase [Nevskiaceae bacterium]MCP5471758.1 NAD+ synthase [Nevskiaceae bacterium]
MRIALAQTDFLVGDVGGNTRKVLDLAAQARAAGADLLLCPELTLSGYPPEDLLFHRGFRHQIHDALGQLRDAARDIGIVVGYPEYSNDQIYNACALFDDGMLQAHHRKACLPNYRVFDEKRYFAAGAQPTVIDFRGFRLGLLICEDIWEPEPAQLARSQGAEILLVINASPYELHKQRARESVARRRALDVGLPVVNVNLLGGQDELVFDGNSFVTNAQGEVVLRAPAYADGLYTAEFVRGARGAAVPQVAEIVPELADEASVYGALVLGVRDYVTKHGFPGVVMGLSGGIDSALTLAIAVDAIGADKVHAVMMPSRYTADISLDDAAAQARRLGVHYSVIPIEGMFAATLAALAAEFEGRPPDTTEENIQSRCRMLLLMGISNKTGRMLLTTGNKSEMAVGYATLYGDMAGGFAPIKDCSKTLVYRLAEYRNAISPAAEPAIPRRVIERPPSAELRPDQRDSDSLPEYPVLDAILEAFIEEDLSVGEIVARGFDKVTVGRVLDLVKRNEYKRRQAPPGVRVSRRAFGRDWRYPITNGYKR